MNYCYYYYYYCYCYCCISLDTLVDPSIPFKYILYSGKR